MARTKVDIKFNKNIEQELRDLDTTADLVEHHAQSIRDACNAESTWGGYEFAAHQAPTYANVWSLDKQKDETRMNRLIRNLDAGG